jgi:urea transport system permease protein
MLRRQQTYLFSERFKSLWLCILLLLSMQVFADAASFQSGVKQLEMNSFDQIEPGIEQIANSNQPEAIVVLNALVDGKLYLLKKTKELVLVTSKEGDTYVVQGLKEKSKPYKVDRFDVKRIRSNNHLRKVARGLAAGLSLQNPDPAIRIAALEDLLKSLSSGDVDKLISLQKAEKNPKALKLINTAIALARLNSDQKTVQINAVNQLASSLEPVVKNRLIQLSRSNTDPALKSAIDRALNHINAKIDAYHWGETLFFGLSLGSVLVLSGIGLAITFGVMGVINMAHGELMMIGAYTTYVVQLLMPNHIGASLFVAIPAAFLISGLVGIAIERGVIRHLYGRPLETLLATFGISLILQQAVRSIFSPLNRSVETPQWMSGALDINPVLSLTLNRLYIILFCLIVFSLLFLVIRKTRLGLQVRAVSQNRDMARAMGVRSQWVDALTFGLGSGVAGVAGVALSQLTNVGPSMGQSYIIDSFMVVVFGGVGNLWGTLVAGMSLGVANKVLEPMAGAVLAKILVLVFIILFIQKRPRGLFPQKGRAAEG